MNKETNKAEIIVCVVVSQTFNSTIAFTSLQTDSLCLEIKHLEIDPSFSMWLLLSSDITQSICYWRGTFIEFYFMHVQEKEGKLC